MKFPESIVGAMGEVSPELRTLLDQIKNKRGNHVDWIRLENLCSRRIAECTPDEHVWCRGEIHGRSRHYPAFVVMNRKTQELKVLAPSGVDDAIEEHDHHFFASRIPHTGICLEVLSEDSSDTTI